jgi:replication factor C large subunit
LWSEKHRPRTLDDVLGNEEGRAKLLAWLSRWKAGGRAALLVGPPGTGKTTTVHLVAEKSMMPLVELNASDTRTKDKLSKRVGEVLGSATLFGTRSLIFLDEVDGLAGRSDYGAIDFIKEAVRRSQNPVVMAANDPDSDEVKKLSSVTTRIEFYKPPEEVVEEFLARIAAEEGVSVGAERLEAVARAANGDLRSAVNLLQSGGTARKDEDLTAQQAVDSFFEAVDEKSALKALRAYPGQPRDKMRDLFAAVVKARVLEERKAAAMEALSKADVVMGRIFRGRDWRLLRYLDPLLASELWTALGDGGARFSMNAVPWPLQLRIWNDARKLRDIALIAGRRLGISQKGSLVEDMPYILLLCQDRGFRRQVAESLGLEENYADFLAKESARTGRLQL